MTNINRPPLDSLACVNPDCVSYALPRQSNLTIRKTYRTDQIRYLRCSHCGQEFSERKNTALWNCKITEDKAIAVAEHLAEGVSLKGTARLTKTHPGTVRRLALWSGRHSKVLHHSQAQDLKCQTLEMDERHGYVEEKSQQVWDAVTIDPASKFLVQLEVGERNEELMVSLMKHSAQRLAKPQDLLLMTDGAPLPQCFSRDFWSELQPSRASDVGRPPNPRYRIPRTLAHVQSVKHRQGKKLVQVAVCKAHGCWSRIEQGLAELGYNQANTSAVALMAQLVG
jgi:ribosomal protein L37AE/L43A